MPINDEKKLLFVHIPKNAGTSVEQHLSMRESGHHTWKEYQSNFENEWESYTSFSIVRDPYTRFVSCYEYAKLEKSFWHSVDGNAIYGKHQDYETCNKHSFKNFANGLLNGTINVLHPGWKQQHTWICNKDGELMIKKLLHYETLQEDMESIGVVGLPTINASVKEHHHYDDSTRSVVNELYKRDFELFYRD